MLPGVPASENANAALRAAVGTARRTGRSRCRGLDLVALGALAHQLPVAADGLRLLPGATLRRLLVVPPHPHLAVEALALHLLLQRAQRLVDIVVANLNLDDGPYSCKALPRGDKKRSLARRAMRDVARAAGAAKGEVRPLAAPPFAPARAGPTSAP
jgi:hypothetical protein